MIKVEITTTTQPREERYMVSVFLVRQGRPKYWSFYCPKCQTKVCEVDGQMIGISDVNDSIRYEDALARPNRVRCNGKYCHYWYEFCLNQ